MMNAVYLCVHMFGAGFAIWTLCRLGKAIWDTKPSSKDKRKELSLLMLIVGVLFIVNFFFWVPDYYSAEYGDLIAGAVVILRSVLTVALCAYIIWFYLRDLKFKYNLSFIVYKKPENSMSQVGELVSFAECEEMMERYRKQHPGCKENFFYSTDFVRQIISTEGAKFLMMGLGLTPDGEETMILWPGDENEQRISMKKLSAARSSGDEEGDDGDYAADRSGTTPGGTKG